MSPRSCTWRSLAASLRSVAYFKLIERVGANRASFTAVAIPVVAMVLSTVFEGYRWTITAAIGAALALAGNYLALTAKRED